ncbi:uncharacterized protein cep126 isoform X2 [Nelusetta ayraudi]|uniref:uncharacterized protein cep126 isoform X2 n=1 Tax=Nelusetta ayraudi TaxID=303726 RepID=UPI003F6FD50E
MLVLQENFYNLNWRLGAKLGLENERNLLEDSQKLGRARARKFSLETNRRRKALEEKQKQWEEQEQLQRQNILQQRRHRVQDATERFQRGHLPSSQRQRQSFRNNVPTMEEALSQIQARCFSNNSRIGTSSLKLPHQALCVVEAHSKLLQEQSAASVKSSQQTERAQDHHGPQAIRLSNVCDSESLSSKDSLECKNSTSGVKNPGSDSCFPIDLEKSHFIPNKHNHVDPTSFYAKMILNYLPQSRLLEQQKLQELEGNHGPPHHALKAVQEDSGVPMNNLNKVLNSEAARRPVGTPSLQQTGASGLKPPEEDDEEAQEEKAQKAPAAVAAPHSSRKVKFLKGILKKPSKFMSEDVACACRSGRSLFAKEVASAIKDSVELTRLKMSEGGGGGVKKKLRWLDEVQTERDNQELRRQMGDFMSAGDHQPSRAPVPGGSRPAQKASTGYHFTKLAWADVGVQVSLQQEQQQQQRPDEVRAPRPPRREHVSLLARKGTVIRPQSTAELSQIALKSQGRFVAPRPPPRPYVGRTPYGADHSGVNGKQAEEVADAPFSVRPHPAVEGGANPRGVAQAEAGPCLNTTPTDEEISQLWHGVRSALSSTDEKSKPRRQSLENGPVSRKAGVEPSRRPPPDSGGSRFPQPSQTTEPCRRPPSTYTAVYSAEGPSVTRCLLAQTHTEDPLPETDTTAGNGNGSALRQRQQQQQQQQQQRPSGVSQEEQKILLSLDRLNQRLLCVHLGRDGGTRGPSFADRRSSKWK